ncbi:MAG: SDR family NAD(P)-dependent oxidoreductase [Phycisphaerales bacterium]|nr:SDR family NAD(P)-dependent oxidoreductase [Phycisphaerales bacterium]
MTNKYIMPPIAVTGVGALFPGDVEPDGFWRTILSGRDCIRDVPAEHWLLDDYYDPDPAVPGKTYARRGAFLSPVDFDPMEHGIPPNMLPSTDSVQLLALIVAKRVLEGCCDFSRVDRDRIAVILGVASATELVSTMSGSLQQPVIEKALRASGLPQNQIEAICDRISQCYVDWTESTFPGLLGNVVAGRIANRFDLGGMNCVIDAACASSLAAMKMAIDQLWTRAADMVITGGVDAISDIFMYMCFSKTLALSPSGDCRPFSDNADGTMLGEGIGMFALRRLEDAERDGDPIYAVIRGIGGSSDGRAKSIYAPRSEGQAKALRRAYETAGYDPGTVELMEAHGTGTVAGDAAEAFALKEVFREARGSGSAWCALGSIKSQIGHTKAAAGSASLYKAVMALHHKALPSTLKLRKPNPALGLAESPFYLNTETRPWIRSADHPRRASVSSFGFGGSNFHLTLEEYQGPAPKPARIRAVETELFLICASQPAGLIERARTAARSASQPGAFASTAYASQNGFSAAENCRLAIVASDAADLTARIERAASSIQKGAASFWIPTGITYGSGDAFSGETAFLFPGQGSQYVGMTAGLALAFDAARTRWDMAADIATAVFPQPGFSSEDREAQASKLTDTRMAQPAIGIASEIHLDILTTAGLRPDLCAGHSFGEVSALFCAGVFSSSDFLRVARERGTLMADAAARLPGAMAAVVGPRNEIEALLPAWGRDIVIANVNSPRQVVIAGPTNQIDAAVAQLTARGVTARRLPVSTAFHSPIVESASMPFSEFLDGIDFHPTQVPVYSNTTAQPYPAMPGQARALLGGQLSKPVNFAGEVTALYDAGARVFIEVGPGSVLTDLVGACLDGKPHLAISTDAKGKNAVTALWFALARLAAAGISFDMGFAWKNYSTAAEAAPKKSSATVTVSGANFGKKYPAQIVEFGLPPSNVEKTNPRFPHSERHSTIQLIQEKMAEAHAAAQRAMAESHVAYLKASELAMTSLFNGHALPAITAMPSVPEPIVPVRAQERAPIEVSAEPIKPIANEAVQLDRLILSVIAEQTGYPVDILTPDMDLEADLGIDSIKRVQILAAISEKWPDLPVVETPAMSRIRTIGAIIDHLNNTSKAPAPAPVGYPIVRFGLKEMEAPPPSSRSLFTKSDRLAIVGCNDDIGTALASILSDRGIDARVSPDVPADAYGTVFLDFDDEGKEDIAAHAQRVFTVAKSFASSRGAQGGALIMVQARGSAWRSGVAGLARTVALEHPACSVRAIEVERGERSPSEIAGIIAGEIVTSGTTDTLRVDAAGQRTVLQEVEQPINGDIDSRLLAGKPVIVASGGARGVTAACLLAAAEIAPLRVALIGRTASMPEPVGLSEVSDAAGLKTALLAAARTRGETPTPRQLESKTRLILSNREINRTLEAFRRLGSEAIYISVDVTDEAATEQAISRIRARWGHIEMLVHGAGVLADKRIAEKSPEQFMRVFGPKVLGLKSLLHATRDDTLRFICIFSSVAGRYGNAGQADYAMANAALNQIAKEEAARRGPQCIVRSLNWGPWDGGMVTPELRNHFAAKGIPVIATQDGVEAFVRELQHKSTDPADVDVVLAAKS